jgi:quinol---cytochrome c reductase iron-sulfur subunit, bacillus type
MPRRNLMRADPPERPGAADPRPEGLLNRRDVLTKLTIAVSALGAAIIGIPFVGFLLAPFFERQPQEWRAVGPADGFKIGKTTRVSFIDASPLPWAGVVARTAAWLRRDASGSFTAFSVNCTHFGCPVEWLADAELFMCPCHGGVYYAEGAVAAGPPPRPLPQYPVRVRNGQVEIRTSPIPITT